MSCLCNRVCKSVTSARISVGAYECVSMSGQTCVSAFVRIKSVRQSSKREVKVRSSDKIWRKYVSVYTRSEVMRRR